MNKIVFSLVCLIAPQLLAAEISLTAEDKNLILTASLNKIGEVYVDASKRESIVDAIKQLDLQAPYDELETKEFIRKLSADLRAVSGDGHLYLRSSAGGQGRRRMLPGQAGDYIDVDLLEENVGYINVRIFGMNAESMTEIDDAMDQVRDAQALVIDLRNCRAGAVTGVEHLLNYLADRSVHYLTSVNTLQGWTSERFTRPEEARFRFDRPVYVLVGEGTFSAGEDFAYSIQLLELGQLVGQSTRGGGYMNMMFPVHEGVQLSVSIGKTFDPKTGKGWQGTGIHADVVVEGEDSLKHVLDLLREKPPSVGE